jgi:protein-S-isoprenylcysteine O-methyltransferase Ste14
VQHHPGKAGRLGGWLFRHRTLLPLPVVLALLIVPAQPSATNLRWLGAAFVLAGEALRLWAVRQIGVISRTRSERLGPLVTSGPFAFVRNPLYLGNLSLWAGFTISAGLIALLPVVLVLLGGAYHAIVRWEEQLLEGRLGEAYHEYARKVPRWIPGRSIASGPAPTGRFSWGQTIFSERGTLIAIAAGYGLLYLKQLIRT